jgi:hypothetical protein
MVSVVQNKAGQRAAAHSRQFKWEIFEHPPYSLEFVPSDNHLFIHPKQFLAGQSLTSDQEIKRRSVRLVERLGGELF